TSSTSQTWSTSRSIGHTTPTSMRRRKLSRAADMVAAANTMHDALHTGSSTTLVGRDRELSLLYDQLTAASRGQTRVVLLAGEPGIGKTRLLRHVQDEAARRGMPLLSGGASEAEGMPPYLP